MGTAKILFSMHLFLSLTTTLRAAYEHLATGVGGKMLKEDNRECMSIMYSQLEDPRSELYSWEFKNITKGFFCNFVGVQCWHRDDDRIYSITLHDLGLRGEFPDGIEHCRSLTSFTISKNEFCGTIPKKLCKWLPYLVTIDLSHNHFTGEIPADLSECSYLCNLNLSWNAFTGKIPKKLSDLTRLNSIDLSNNHLRGTIPAGLARFNASAFTNNSDLCGSPLRSCYGDLQLASVFIIFTAIVGIFIFFFLIYVLWSRIRAEKVKYTEENKWVSRINMPYYIEVTMFQRPIVGIKFSDLIRATDYFSHNNIIGTGRLGTDYKATLHDGSELTIKRLKGAVCSDKMFECRACALGNLRRRNIVPLLGFCGVGKERFLVYKHMVNGSLRDILHKNCAHNFDWGSRVRICIGGARGLTWLHHRCHPAVVHSNITSSCILLDEDYEARITNYALEALTEPLDPTQLEKSSQDLGYLPPECGKCFVPTLKGDVYSFGVVVLEIVTGQMPGNLEHDGVGFHGNLVEWVCMLSSIGKPEDALDKSMMGRGHDEVVLQLLKIGLSCVVSEPSERPTINEVYKSLKSVGHKYDFPDEKEELMFYQASYDFKS